LVVTASVGARRKLTQRVALRRSTLRRNFQTAPSSALVNAKCGGVDDTATLNSAVKAAGNGLVVIGAGETCAVSDVTIPSLRIEKGGLLRVVTGRTAKLSSLFEGGTYQVFDNALPGQGTISFSGNTSLREVYPEWWGGLTNALPANQMGAFQKAVDTGMPVRLSATLTGNGYVLDNAANPLMLDKTVNNTVILLGAGMDSTLVRCTSNARPCIQIDYPRAGAPSVVIRDFHLRGAAGATPKSIPGNFGVYVPGYHDGVGHSISNLTIENMQIDQFGDNAIRIQGPTGPVRILNPVINDVGDYGIQISSDTDPNPDQSQDVTIDGGSLQGQARGGIAVTGTRAAILSLTIRDTDIELRENQTKPALYFQGVHGAHVSGVTLASLVGSLTTGDANIYLSDGVYGCTFIAVLNAAYGGLHNVHAAGVTRQNTFIGGVYLNKSSGPGYLYKRESGSPDNTFINPFVSSGSFQRGHDALPEGALATPGGSAGRATFPLFSGRAKMFLATSLISLVPSLQ
jgi:hypothetical protein